jgi:hypothetical protein
MKCFVVMLHLIILPFSNGKRVHPFDPELNYDSTYLTYHFEPPHHQIMEEDTSSAPGITKIQQLSAYSIAIAPVLECGYGQLRDPNGICRRKWGWSI